MTHPIQTHKRRWLAIFGFLALAVLLIGNPSPLAVQKDTQAGWRVEIEPGRTARSSLTINNRCAEPHRFRVKSRLKYLHFEQPTDAILIGPSSSQLLGVVFDAGRKSKVYRDKVIVECVDCKKSRGCHQDRDKVPVEMVVLKPSIQQTPAGSSSNLMAGGWGLCCTLYGSGNSIHCASPATNCFDEIVVTPKAFGTLDRFNVAVDRNVTAAFFSGKEWKLLFPNFEKFPKQLNMLRAGLPLLRFETSESGVARYLATRLSRAQITKQMESKSPTPISGAEFCLTVRQQQ